MEPSSGEYPQMAATLSLPDDPTAHIPRGVHLRYTLLDLVMHLHIREDFIEYDVAPDTTHGDLQCPQARYIRRSLLDLVLQHANVLDSRPSLLETVALLHRGHGAFSK